MINIAVIGTGGISHAHIRAYLKFPERCRIAALVDIIPGKAQRVKEHYGLDADVYLDHHDILDKGWTYARRRSPMQKLPSTPSGAGRT